MELILVILAMAVGAFAKGVTGSGLPMFAIPVMATFIGVEPAIVIMAIPGIVTNTWLLIVNRGSRHHTRDLPVLLITGSVGGVAGTWLLTSLNEQILSGVLASMVFFYVALFFLKPDLKLEPQVTRYTSPFVGTFAGALQGATGISGPVVTTYLHSFRMPKEAYVFAVTTMFQVFAVVQTVTLVGVGLFNGERLVRGLLSLIPIMIMLPLGSAAAKRMPHRYFDKAVLGVMVVTAGKLLYDAIA
ncbi:MAG: TSUP family transporter [Actinobacteria bacterium]|nr:TSUP family transporter [Actinomycetota bacterium]